MTRVTMPRSQANDKVTDQSQSVNLLFSKTFTSFARFSYHLMHVSTTISQCHDLDHGHINTGHQRTSDGGNGNHSVSLPIILIKIKVDQMLPSSYICSLLVSIL